jgi:hypothetical protein
MAIVITENLLLKEGLIMNNEGVAFAIPTDDTHELLILDSHTNTSIMAISLLIKPTFCLTLIIF